MPFADLPADAQLDAAPASQQTFAPLPDGALIAPPLPAPPSAVAALTGVGVGQQPKPFNILPAREDPDGSLHFDLSQGITGALGRAISAPADAYRGAFDPTSPEGNRRALETSLLISPASAGMQAGERVIPGALKAFRRDAPTAQELKTAASAGYDATRATGAEYPGQAVGAAADATRAELDGKGFLAEVAPQTHAILGKLQNPPDGSIVGITSLDAARQGLNKIPRTEQTAADYGAAQLAIRRIDDFIRSRGQAAAVAGSPAAGYPSAADGAGTGGLLEVDPAQQAAADLITQARGNTAAAKRSDRLTGIEDAADLRAAAANSGQNSGNALRQRLASFVLDQNKTRGFTPGEIADLRSIVDGTITSNGLRRVSNMLGGGGGLGQTLMAMLGAGVGQSIDGGVGAAIGAAAGPAVGQATRSAYNGLVSRQLGKVDTMVRQRSPLFDEQPLIPISPEKRAALVRALLLIDDAGTPR